MSYLPMDKNRILELLARKITGEATLIELEELNELMSMYPDSIYYDEILRQLWSKSESLTDADSFTESAYLRQQDKYKSEFKYPLVKRISTKARVFKTPILSVMLALVMMIGFYCLSSSVDTSPDIEIVAGKGLRKKIALPDGTVVWLNSDSKISYKANIGESRKRVVFLTGEAFFDVSHRQNRPFIVRTDQFSIKVLGTTFNVRAYPIDKKSEATLIDGSIELSVNDKPQQKIVLNPSEKFALVQKKKSNANDDNQANQDVTLMIESIDPVQIGNREYIEETSWKDSQLVFKNESFEEIKPKLERWFNVHIQFKAEKAKSYHFTGVFKNENLREALTAMQLIKPFNFKQDNHDVIIY